MDTLKKTERGGGGENFPPGKKTAYYAQEACGNSMAEMLQKSNPDELKKREKGKEGPRKGGIMKHEQGDLPAPEKVL